MGATQHLEVFTHLSIVTFKGVKGFEPPNLAFLDYVHAIALSHLATPLHS